MNMYVLINGVLALQAKSVPLVVDASKWAMWVGVLVCSAYNIIGMQVHSQVKRRNCFEWLFCLCKCMWNNLNGLNRNKGYQIILGQYNI